MGKNIKRICQSCGKEQFLVKDFPFFPLEVRHKICEDHFYGNAIESAFSDQCFDCYSLRRGAYASSLLMRVPTYQEIPSAFRIGQNTISMPTRGYAGHFREIRAARKHQIACRICGQAGKLKKHSRLRLCARCSEILPSSVRRDSAMYDESIFYPYRWIFRRLGPYCWESPAKVFDGVGRGFDQFVREVKVPKHRQEQEGDQTACVVEWLNALGPFFSKDRGPGKISYKQLIGIGHHMHKYRIRIVRDLRAFVTKIDPKSRYGSTYLSGSQVRYLVGDTFPYPDMCYLLIRYGIMNRAIWGPSYSLEGDRSDKLSNEELLGLTFCTRVLKESSLRILILRWTYALVLSTQVSKEFRSRTKLDLLRSSIERRLIGKDNDARLFAISKEGVFVDVLAESRLCIEELCKYQTSPDFYESENILVALGQALADPDLWWTMIQIAELVIQKRLTEAIDVKGSPFTIGGLWADIVTRMWTMVGESINPSMFRNDEFCFPPERSFLKDQTHDNQPQQERSLHHDQTETEDRQQG